MRTREAATAWVAVAVVAVAAAAAGAHARRAHHRVTDPVLLSMRNKLARPLEGGLPLTLLTGEAARGSACLDGSPYGYYFRAATSTAGSTRWTVWMQGGGWCYNEAECADRAQSRLGSSKFWDPNGARPFSLLSPLTPRPDAPSGG